MDKSITKLDLKGARHQHHILDKLENIDIRYLDEVIENFIEQSGDFGIPITTYVLHRTLKWKNFNQLLSWYLSGGSLIGPAGKETILGEEQSARMLAEIYSEISV